MPGIVVRRGLPRCGVAPSQPPPGPSRPAQAASRDPGLPPAAAAEEGLLRTGFSPGTALSGAQLWALRTRPVGPAPGLGAGGGEAGKP